MRFLFNVCAKLPLWILHAAGAVLGWLTYWLSPTYRRNFLKHAHRAGYSAQQIKAAIAHAGRMAAELPRLWLGAPTPIQWQGQEVFDAAHANGRGIIFLTPHLGCFEITGQAIAQRYAPQGRELIALYRPARQAWLRHVMTDARDRPGMRAVPATRSGIKLLLNGLRSGHSLIILPDQVPALGSGVWAPFFGHPAYTMTLCSRLAQQTGAQLINVWGERLAWGKGYRVHFSAFHEILSDQPEVAAQQINASMEQLIRQCPEQYLWGYARHKTPRQDSPGTVS